ncbi:hypothetical protein Bpfe_021914 [Biomphalaria pfeifferi]|uniref:MULE transposase domain-containing protein n=1 Tax=Biomphalaria pfeifferi TaxID=112525 RepID=A0AAD8F3F2_BIOPF|nr:hypothetical protein Bpfe_021914 [Biomphalaria pfeifferi]
MHYCQTKKEKNIEAVKELWPDLNPSSVSVDFELAANGALQSIYQLSAIYGCLFHLTKNIRKKLADENLLSLYNNDPECALAARMIVALTFIPIEDLDMAVETLANELPLHLTPIINWFEDTYIGRLNRSRTRRCTLFPPPMCKCLVCKAGDTIQSLNKPMLM